VVERYLTSLYIDFKVELLLNSLREMYLGLVLIPEDSLFMGVKYFRTHFRLCYEPI